MGRVRRVDVGGMVYHGWNRANFRSRLFKSEAHDQDFLALLEESLNFVALRILAYCLMKTQRRSSAPGRCPSRSIIGSGLATPKAGKKLRISAINILHQKRRGTTGATSAPASGERIEARRSYPVCGGAAATSGSRAQR